MTLRRHDERPNVVVILSDDQGPWAMRCAGNSELETPNLDRLAATGMRFDRFFCTSPVCSPARASLLTGRIPSCHGVHDWLAAGNTIAKYEPARNGELIDFLTGQPAYTDALAKAGYACGLSGKWHLGDCHRPRDGFVFWDAHAKGGGPYYRAPMVRHGEVYEEPNYVTDAITMNALRFLEQRKSHSQPFYLSVHYTSPHSPWDRENHPKELFDQYHDGCPFTSTPDLMPAPDWVKHRSIPVDDAGSRRQKLSGYYAAITAMDTNIGKIIDWLEENGKRENTLVVFTSDNGMCMGHHGLWGKGNASFPLNMFEESVRVPLLASHPGVIEGGALNSDLLSQYDFSSTLLEYVGISTPSDPISPGRSFCELLKGGRTDPNEHLVVFDEYGPVRMVRTREWKYVHRYPYGPNELYHLINDPAETENRISDPAARPVLREMRERLHEWFATYSDPDRNGATEPVTGRGQTGLCGSRARGEDVFIPF